MAAGLRAPPLPVPHVQRPRRAEVPGGDPGSGRQAGRRAGMSALGALDPAGLFRPLSAEDEEQQQPAEIESLCMACLRQVRGPSRPVAR